nr:transcription initiation factor TFIID subunit 11-like [Ipomoea batatas]
MDVQLGKFTSSTDPDKKAKMQSILSQFTEEQMSRYESFRRSGFQKSNMKRLLVSITGSQKISVPMTIVMSGIAKMFVGELIETEVGGDSNLVFSPLSINSLWIDLTLPLKSSFKHVVDSVYKAAYESVSTQVNNPTRLIFASALYFNGAWTQEFDAWMVKDHEFHLLNGRSIHFVYLLSICM